ncbi:MAG: (2Fe-2S)-binding protein [Labilithrix sp.]|nr:(2Fe-2S)-binding protein [Labilithrix sp.]MBX3223170.1 (2Fe-2S)-binding protein [Labilithrix sp.]
MPSSRIRPLENPVTFTLDGEELEAERGEPLAAALIAAGKTTIARSPKFHRPRGPACMRGACDGCLARVDDAPNVMTCLVPAEEGSAVVTQNRLGPRDTDLLRMTDWFFPEGMNHHELFAGVPGIQTIMQGFARRVAGLGKLPLEAAAPRPAARRSADVVVVGAGPAGMAVAVRLARASRAVEVLDDQLTPGGGVTALAREDAAAFEPIRAAFSAGVASGAIRLRSRTTAGAVYGRDLLVAGEEGAEIVEARALVLACGAHDGALAFEGNDMPNVMSARAAGWLLSRGVLVGARIAVVVTGGGGPFGESFARAARQRAEVTVLHGEPLSIRGSSRVKGVRVRTATSEREVDADAVLVDAARSPAFELCQQAGAALVHEPRGFVVKADDGRIADGIWATGEVCGLPFDPHALEAHAALVATQIAS